ncbi:hypothetical protein [Parachryseolinea silvisoli]|uniref:hypothetical protein n=1 Tax=Parachryseolinea silvisoli TaxID=2873601 RepID=UPI0022658DD0|nr:hypothetical protein [Parachryseolinea silvisoli]MCD9015229.1 hypothetical protein [Parachryseolinea silvisoli]
MKRVITALFVMQSLGAFAQTPNFNEMFKQKKTQIRYLVAQIAALQVYLEKLKKGYEIVDKGLNTIGSIKDGKFSMDKDYLNSLKAVSPVIANSPLLDQIVYFNSKTLSGLRDLEEEIIEDENFSESERDYVSGIRKRSITQSKARLDELEWLITPGQSEMTDDERLGHLEQIHAQCKRSFLFAGDLIQSTRLLARQRAKERGTIEVLRKLHGVSL